MERISPQQLRQLLEPRTFPCLSIYIPTHAGGASVREDPIRLRNVITRSRDQLMDAGMPGGDAERFLQPLRDLLPQGQVWRSGSRALAIFLAQDFFEYHQLPVGAGEVLVVGERFYVKPLLGALRAGGAFYVLAASQNHVRLLRCTLDEAQPVALPDVRPSLEEFLAVEPPEKSLQWHARTAPAAAPMIGGAMFHSQGGCNDDTLKKADMLRYLQHIDRGLPEALEDPAVPLVFAGVDYLFALYRQASGRRNLVEQPVVGNPDRLSDGQLLEQARPLAAPALEAARDRLLDAYRHHRNSPRASHRLEQILPDAGAGRVATLFVRTGAQQWGRYDPQRRSVELHARWQRGDEDLIDSAAVETLRHGGQVYPVEAEELPGTSPVAAVLRY